MRQLSQSGIQMVNSYIFLFSRENRFFLYWHSVNSTTLKSIELVKCSLHLPASNWYRWMVSMLTSVYLCNTSFGDVFQIKSVLLFIHTLSCVLVHLHIHTLMYALKVAVVVPVIHITVLRF